MTKSFDSVKSSESPIHNIDDDTTPKFDENSPGFDDTSSRFDDTSPGYLNISLEQSSPDIFSKILKEQKKHYRRVLEKISWMISLISFHEEQMFEIIIDNNVIEILILLSNP
jgi:hypothetical protein